MMWRGLNPHPSHPGPLPCFRKCPCGIEERDFKAEEKTCASTFPPLQTSSDFVATSSNFVIPSSYLPPDDSAKQQVSHTPSLSFCCLHLSFASSHILQCFVEWAHRVEGWSTS